MAVSAAPVITEDRLSDQVDGDGQEDQPEEQESQQQGCLLDDDFTEGIVAIGHGDIRL